MRLLIGLVAFLAWSGGSAYWYVCKVKGLCSEEIPATELLADSELAPGKSDNSDIVLGDEVSPKKDKPHEKVYFYDDCLPDHAVVVEELSLSEEELLAEDATLSDNKNSSAREDNNAQSAYPEKHTILFAYAKPLIANKAKADKYMEEVAAFLLGNPKAKVKVVGYTDDTAAKYKNKELGMKRAEAIATLLEGHGVPRAKMILESLGEANPVATNETPAGRKLNRRVEITVQSNE